jgi:dTMP kinase
VRQVIKPSLARGAIVLCDRSSDSTLAYQGYGHRADVDRVRRWDLDVRDGVAPDLTLLLDCPIDQAARRRGTHPDRYQRLDADFHERVRQGFLALAEAEPTRIRRIDASQDQEAVHAEVARIALASLAERTES